MTVAVPILGYLIIYNDRFLEWAGNFRLVGEQPGASSILSINILYLSLSVIGFSVAITSFACPKICRRFNDCEDYSRFEVERISRSNFQIAKMRVENKRRRLFSFVDGVRLGGESVDLDIANLNRAERKFIDEQQKIASSSSDSSADLIFPYQAYGSEEDFRHKWRMEIIRILDWIYVYNSLEQPLIRMACFSLYLIGGIGLLALSVRSFLGVLDVIF